MKITPQEQAYQSLLLMFADLFKYPEKDFYEEIASGELDNQIKELGQSGGWLMITKFKDQAINYQEVIAEFNKCFLGVHKPFVSQVESVYKVWTTDESYQVPFKNQKGYLMGDSALHIKHLLDAFGLTIPKEYEMMPDHLTILLELYAYFLEQGMFTEAKQFAKDHLDWLPDFCEALQAIEPDGFYTYTAGKLLEVLAFWDSTL